MTRAHPTARWSVSPRTEITGNSGSGSSDSPSPFHAPHGCLLGPGPSQEQRKDSGLSWLYCAPRVPGNAFANPHSNISPTGRKSPLLSPSPQCAGRGGGGAAQRRKKLATFHSGHSLLGDTEDGHLTFKSLSGSLWPRPSHRSGLKASYP